MNEAHVSCVCKPRPCVSLHARAAHKRTRALSLLPRCRREVLQSQVTQATQIIERKLVEEAANEQAAAAKGDTARAARIAAVRIAAPTQHAARPWLSVASAACCRAAISQAAGRSPAGCHNPT